AWRESRREARQRLHLPEGPIVPRRSIAVLGFKDRSGRADTAWLSAALAEMLSTELGAGKDLRVVAGENVARMKVELNLGESDSLARDTLARIRTLLGTDYVVLGSYVALDGKAGRQIRLDLRLQDAAAGETTSAVAVSGTETELFDLVARAGTRLRGDLGGSAAATDSGALRASLPASPEAARLYAEGLTRLRLLDPPAARGPL